MWGSSVGHPLKKAMEPDGLGGILREIVVDVEFGFVFHRVRYLVNDKNVGIWVNRRFLLKTAFRLS